MGVVRSTHTTRLVWYTQTPEQLQPVQTWFCGTANVAVDTSPGHTTPASPQLPPCIPAEGCVNHGSLIWFVRSNRSSVLGMYAFSGSPVGKKIHGELKKNLKNNFTTATQCDRLPSSRYQSSCKFAVADEETSFKQSAWRHSRVSSVTTPVFVDSVTPKNVV